VGVSVFPVAVLAMAASLFHLGRPFAAWRAFSTENLSSERRGPVLRPVPRRGLSLFVSLVAPENERAAGRGRHHGLPWSCRGHLELSDLSHPGRNPGIRFGFPLLPGVDVRFGGLAALSFTVPREDPSGRRVLLAVGAIGSLTIMLSAVWMVANSLGRFPMHTRAPRLKAPGISFRRTQRAGSDSTRPWRGFCPSRSSYCGGAQRGARTGAIGSSSGPHWRHNARPGPDVCRRIRIPLF